MALLELCKTMYIITIINSIIVLWNLWNSEAKRRFSKYCNLIRFIYIYYVYK